ncbi:MAG TPA: hypothetical protein PLU55_00570 [Candidatus Pacearchaeota archaeon]|nr:hypothetical protein [Candidatus Pacearchaeota archaeon]
MKYKLLSAKSGKSEQEIKEVHKQAIQEAKILGLKDNLLEEFCLTYIEEEFDLDNIKKVTTNLNRAFEKSNHVCFKDFMDDLFVEEGEASSATMSTDFPVEDRPQGFKKKKDEEEKVNV